MKTKSLFVALAILSAAAAHAASSESMKSLEAEKAESYSKESQARAKEEVASGKVSTIQSAARPFKLDIVSPVEIAATDEASKIFQEKALPDYLKISESRLNEAEAAKAIDAIRIDPNKLTLVEDTSVRIYFVGEGAGYRNTLGFSTIGETVNARDAALIFPDASTNMGLGGSGKEIRDKNGPLLAGDFVDLGTFKAGTKLDFFLIADGANGGKNIFSTVDSLNKDGLTHAVSLAPEGSPYLLLSFEDIFGGGDSDYNDLVFAVEIGTKNVQHLAEVAKLTAPEPSMAIGGLLSCGVLLMGRRRRRTL